MLSRAGRVLSRSNIGIGGSSRAGVGARPFFARGVISKFFPSSRKTTNRVEPDALVSRQCLLRWLTPSNYSTLLSPFLLAFFASKSSVG